MGDRQIQKTRKADQTERPSFLPERQDTGFRDRRLEIATFGVRSSMLRDEAFTFPGP